MTVPSHPLRNTPPTDVSPTRGQIVTGSYHDRMAHAHQRIANLYRSLGQDPNDEVLAEQLHMAQADLVALSESLRTPTGDHQRTSTIDRPDRYRRRIEFTHIGVHRNPLPLDVTVQVGTSHQGNPQEKGPTLVTQVKDHILTYLVAVGPGHVQVTADPNISRGHAKLRDEIVAEFTVLPVVK